MSVIRVAIPLSSWFTVGILGIFVLFTIPLHSVSESILRVTRHTSFAALVVYSTILATFIGSAGSSSTHLEQTRNMIGGLRFAARSWNLSYRFGQSVEMTMEPMVLPLVVRQSL